MTTSWSDDRVFGRRVSIAAERQTPKDPLHKIPLFSQRHHRAVVKQAQTLGDSISYSLSLIP